jgi:RND family efflux transporter MFP subunit
MNDLKTDLASLRIEDERRSTLRGSRRGAKVWRPRNVLWVVAIPLLAAVAGWWWITRSPSPVVQTWVQTPTRPGAPSSTVLDASGYVTARRRSTVSARVTGKIAEILVEEGMSVRAGQVLARLDDSDARAGLALAEAQLDAAQRSIDEIEVRVREAQVRRARLDLLLEARVIAAAEFDTATAEVDVLEARLRTAASEVTVAERQVAQRRIDIADTVVRAPFDGVAISKDAQAGEMVSPVSAGGGFTRTGISTIVDMSSLEIQVDVNEAYINRVARGQPVTAVLDAYPDWRIPARVITTVPAADRQKATVQVRIAFDELDPRILPDMGVKVSFLPGLKESE